MNDTVTNRTLSAKSARLRAYLGQERESRPHPATLSLQRRPHQRDGDSGRKISEYARIARGRHV
ncbi:MAG: hypothetical protein Q4G26_03355 [Paracoccus sp. (in: a-proteobacteria)]|nr:hypothetical protein [Paracoccus sp. (in: a-proteobacteria)]